jgi:hypothetical protein
MREEGWEGGGLTARGDDIKDAITNLDLLLGLLVSI